MNHRKSEIEKAAEATAIWKAAALAVMDAKDLVARWQDAGRLTLDVERQLRTLRNSCDLALGLKAKATAESGKRLSAEQLGGSSLLSGVGLRRQAVLRELVRTGRYPGSWKYGGSVSVGHLLDGLVDRGLAAQVDGRYYATRKGRLAVTGSATRSANLLPITAEELMEQQAIADLKAAAGPDEEI